MLNVKCRFEQKISRRGPSGDGRGSAHPSSTPSTFLPHHHHHHHHHHYHHYVLIIYIFLGARGRPSTMKFETLGLSNKEVLIISKFAQYSASKHYLLLISVQRGMKRRL